MAKTYFIGGAPRVGKTTAIQRLIERRPMLAASTDSIRYVAKHMIKPEDNPKLFKTERGAFDSPKNIENLTHNPELILKYELDESEETWKAVLNFINYNLLTEKDVAIEGVAVLPHNVTNLEFNNKTVFLVNLEDQTEIILRHARQSSGDWLTKYSDEAIKAFCIFNQKLNRYYYDEASKLNLPIIEVRGESFDEDINKAVDILLTY